MDGNWGGVEGAYVDDVQGFVDGGLGVEGEAGVDFGGDFSGNDFEDLFAELDEEAVERGVDLGVKVFSLAYCQLPLCPVRGEASNVYMFLAIFNSNIHQLGIFCFLRGGEDEGGIRGGILWLVFVDCFDLLDRG